MRKEETSLVHDIVIITIITLIAGLLLGVIHSITAGPIAAQEEKTRIRTQKAVFPAASSFKVVEGIADDEVLIEKVADTGLTKTEVCAVDIAYDEAGDKLGYVVTSLNKEGYGGEIKIMTGIDTTGEVSALNRVEIKPSVSGRHDRLYQDRKERAERDRCDQRVHDHDELSYESS